MGGASRAAGASKTSARSASVTQRQADKRSLGAQFKQQLSELVKLIESGRAHYVRCVKPNSLVRCLCFFFCVCMYTYVETGARGVHSVSSQICWRDMHA